MSIYTRSSNSIHFARTLYNINKGPPYTLPLPLPLPLPFPHPPPPTPIPTPITHHPSPITHHPSPITHHPSPITHHPLPLISHSHTHHPSTTSPKSRVSFACALKLEVICKSQSCMCELHESPYRLCFDNMKWRMQVWDGVGWDGMGWDAFVFDLW